MTRTKTHDVTPAWPSDVVRVSNDDVYCHLYDVLEDIAECLEARPSWPGDPADR